VSPIPEPTRRDGTRVCSIADALELVGERWSLLVVREVGLGVRRFNDIQRNTGAPREMLTARLRRLEEAGVLTRSQYSEHPPRYDYELTEAGRALIPILHDLRTWGERFATPRPGRGRAGPETAERGSATCSEAARSERQ
jgi:DNA-binding HxlR family transcriptional regulator